MLPSTQAKPEERLLEVRGLTVRFPTRQGAVHAVEDLTFNLSARRTLAVVGESGSGKSATALALVGLHRTAQVSGEVRLAGLQLVGAPDKVLRSVRGERIGMIFQDPLSALHPHYTVGAQIAEAYRAHRNCSKRDALRRAAEMLDLVRIPGAARRIRDYPHQFSGGMRQRIMIAMALACDPELLIADEPTTALDVTTQAEVLELMRDLQHELGMSIILITHNLGIVGEMADDVMVMYAGRVVERATVADLFGAPNHPYTAGLLGSVVRLDQPRPETLVAIGGQPPSLVDLPGGCAFHPRCAYRIALCTNECPSLRPLTSGHDVSCHRAAEPRRAGTSLPEPTQTGVGASS